LRIPIGLLYRLKRVSKAQNRPHTWEAKGVILAHVKQLEAQLGLGAMTADEIRELSERPLSDTEVKEIVEWTKRDD
jgi:predicted DNA-binding protein